MRISKIMKFKTLNMNMKIKVWVKEKNTCKKLECPQEPFYTQVLKVTSLK